MNDNRMTRCDDCGNECTVDELAKSLCEMHHLYERIEPGEEVPAGECECGACAHIVKDERPLPVIHSLEVERWTVEISRGEDDGAMVVSIDSTEADSKDHTARHLPRLYIYVNDVRTYDFTKDRP